MERREINDEMLIHEVSKRRSLWDQTSFDYMNRSLKLDDWGTVALEMNATEEEVKMRWKILKDTFNREVRIIARNNTTNFVHFERMSFLLKGLNNLLLPSSYLSQSEINTTASDIDFSENFTPGTEDDGSSSSSRKKMKYHRPQSNNSSGVFSSISTFQSTPMLELKESTGAHAEFASEDYYFLMSLLPTFDKMSARHKMQAKIKMMQVVFESAFEDSVNDRNVSSKNSSMGNESNSISSGS